MKKILFELSKNDVRILGVGGYFNLDTGSADPAAKFVETVPTLCTRPASVSEVSFGDCLAVSGGAFVGGCEGKSVKRYLLDYKSGFETNCNATGWTNFWEVDYATLAQNRFINWRTDSSVLTSDWVDDCFVPSFVAARPVSPFRKVEPLSLIAPLLANACRTVPVERALHVAADRRGNRRLDPVRHAAHLAGQ